eukprot:scaffold293948_cov14-Tisochrysis_lutea.AAC.1
MTAFSHYLACIAASSRQEDSKDVMQEVSCSDGSRNLPNTTDPGSSTSQVEAFRKTFLLAKKEEQKCVGNWMLPASIWESEALISMQSYVDKKYLDHTCLDHSQPGQGL